MEGWTRCYAPQEAWEILQERREACYDNYAALYSGNVRSLIRTAPRGSFWARPGKSRVHVPLAADLAATSANLLFGEEPARVTVSLPEGEVQLCLEPPETLFETVNPS